MQQEEKVIYINIDNIVPNKNQPRKMFDEQALNELSNSIKEYGILNPILVKKTEDKYEIIAGERRYRAAKMAGLKEIPTIIKNYEEAKIAEIALIENLHRENLNPIEEAKSYQEIMRLSKITQKSLGEKLGKSQAAIANKLRLLNLPPKIQEAVKNKKISERHARSLMQIEDEEDQLELLNKIIENKMTVKEVDDYINQQTVTEKEIQDAINEIMKSLNIENEEEIKKEEKESDNMNNGNFFPNFNNTMENTNNVSLNSMNMQSMTMPQMAPIQEQTTQNNINYMDNQMMNPQPIDNQTPMMNNNFMQDIPLFTQPQEMSMPNNEQSMAFNQMMEQPVMNQPINVEPQINPYQDAPLFDNNFNNQMVMNQVESQPMMMEQPQSPMIENYNMMPEQNSPVNEMPIMESVEAPMMNTQEQPLVEETSPIPSFEIPVNSEPAAVIEPVMEQPDKLSELKNYLEQNNINYKHYSNESGNCIIIEM